MKTFRANHGTVFRFQDDLSGAVTIWPVLPAQKSPAPVEISAEDFMQFAAHVAGLPPWQPEKDAFDRQTTELMLAHVEKCPDCNLETRCSKYWTLILDRVREKERRAKN